MRSEEFIRKNFTGQKVFEATMQHHGILIGEL